MSGQPKDERGSPPTSETSVLRVRQGHGANCSSIGSVVDTVFLGAVAGGVILAMVAAAMRRESVTVIGAKSPDKQPDPEPAKMDGTSSASLESGPHQVDDET